MLLKSSVLPFFNISHELNLDKLKARIDVVREGLVSNPLDVDLEMTITELMLEVSNLIFDKKWITPLPIRNWLVIINFILSFNEVSASARKRNRTLNFSAQRSVFVILGYIFNHPQYSELCDSRTGDNVFNVTQTMFSEAERQNYTPLLFGDIYAEGDWISNIIGRMSPSLRFGPNQEGLTSALRLWESFVSYSAKSIPERIPKLFENIKDAATSNLYGHLHSPIMWQETEAFQLWRKMFDNIKPCRISTLKQYDEAFKVLQGEEVDGDWAIFNRAFGENSNFMGELPKIEDVWAECIQGSVFDSIAYMYGECAFNDLWKELRECWYLSQPEDADGIYCDHEFFSRSPQAFSYWVSNHIVPMQRTLHDRHDLKIHIASACTVLIGDMINKGSHPSFILDSIINAEELARFIDLLKTKSEIIKKESVKNAFGWEDSEAKLIKSKVDKFLTLELYRCKKYIADSIKKCIPIITINSNGNNFYKGDRERVYEAWNQTNQNFWKQFCMGPAIKVSFSTSLASNTIKIPFKAHESYYLSEKSGKSLSGLDFDGARVASSLKYKIAQSLKAYAKTSVSKVAADCTWFISDNVWNSEAKSKLKARYGLNLPSDKIFVVSGNQSFIVEKDAAELVLHKWTFMPWSEGERPIVVYGFTEFSEFTYGVSSLYYEFRVLNPSGIQLLDDL